MHNEVIKGINMIYRTRAISLLVILKTGLMFYPYHLQVLGWQDNFIRAKIKYASSAKLLSVLFYFGFIPLTSGAVSGKVLRSYSGHRSLMFWHLSSRVLSGPLAIPLKNTTIFASKELFYVRETHLIWIVLINLHVIPLGFMAVLWLHFIDELLLFQTWVYNSTLK